MVHEDGGHVEVRIHTLCPLCGRWHRSQCGDCDDRWRPALHIRTIHKDGLPLSILNVFPLCSPSYRSQRTLHCGSSGPYSPRMRRVLMSPLRPFHRRQHVPHLRWTHFSHYMRHDTTIITSGSQSYRGQSSGCILACSIILTRYREEAWC